MFKENLEEPMLARRAEVAKQDPTEELIDLHEEIAEMEKQFS